VITPIAEVLNVFAVKGFFGGGGGGVPTPTTRDPAFTDP
jgi:hypothetical protein